MAYDYAFRSGVSLEMGISLKWIESLMMYKLHESAMSNPADLMGRPSSACQRFVRLSMGNTIYISREKYTGWEAIFPGIEASNSILRCKIGPPFS